MTAAITIPETQKVIPFLGEWYHVRVSAEIAAAHGIDIAGPPPVGCA